MCNNNGNCSWIIIIILVLMCCCGGFSTFGNNGNDCGCGGNGCC